MGDFAAWFEAWIGGRWHMFDPRNNVPRMGRILMARGRDASDVAIATTFGPNTLESFRVWTDEIPDGRDCRNGRLMSFLTVRHSTVYRYREPVGLGEHRMMFRPRESHDLRLIQTNLVITPKPAQLRWLHDPFDNSVAVATFEGTTSELRFESTVTLEHFETSLPEYPLEEYARTYPFRYSDEDFPNLVRALARHYPGESVSKWALQFLDPSDTTGTMKMLRAMTSAFANSSHTPAALRKACRLPRRRCRIGGAVAGISRS